MTTPEEMGPEALGEHLLEQLKLTAKAFGTQAALADACGVTGSAVTRWFKGAEFPSLQPMKTLDAAECRTERGDSFLWIRERIDQLQEAARLFKLPVSEAYDALQVADALLGRMSEDRREEYYKAFRQHKPVTVAPRPWVLSSQEVQMLGETIDAISVRDAIAAFGIAADFVELPQTEDSFVALGTLQSELRTHLPNTVSNVGLTGDQANVVHALYQYLGCSRDEDATLNNLVPQELDAILVPGARGSFHTRVIRAADLCRQSGGQAVIIFSGQRPDNEVLTNVLLSEADAMKHYFDFHLQPELDGARIEMERRARGLRDTAFLALPILEQLSYERQSEALTVALVAPPYLMRRFLLIAKAQFKAFPNVVSQLKCAVSTPRQGLNELIGAKVSVDTRVDALALYLGEGLKLIGGRATGQF